MSANAKIIGAGRTAVGLQKAFLAIILVLIAMALFNLNPDTRTNFFSEANFINVLKSASIFMILAMGETVVLIAGGVDLSIGNPGKLAQGIGSGVLRAFAQRLVRQGYRTIVIDPDPENRRAVRAYERAGFRAIPRLLDRTGGTLIMQYEPKENDPDR